MWWIVGGIIVGLLLWNRSAQARASRAAALAQIWAGAAASSNASPNASQPPASTYIKTQSIVEAPGVLYFGAVKMPTSVLMPNNFQSWAMVPGQPVTAQPPPNAPADWLALWSTQQWSLFWGYFNPGTVGQFGDTNITWWVPANLVA